MQTLLTRQTLIARLTTTTTTTRITRTMSSSSYSMADQAARFAKAKADNNERYLNIDSVYDGSFLKDKRVAITGANRGLGLELAKAVVEAGSHLVAICRSSSTQLEALKPVDLVTDVDVTDNAAGDKVVQGIKGGPIDILINNAGYFMREEETLQNLHFDEELKMIDICAIGPLRITAALVNAELLKQGSKIVMITSQGGSVSWRTTQNPQGHDYGHHMSKAAQNMMAMLLSQEVKSKNIAVGILHPGFNKTGMTEKYKEIWEQEGAVDPSVGAKRVLYETGKLTMESSGKFINCEDGLEIPF